MRSNQHAEMRIPGLRSLSGSNPGSDARYLCTFADMVPSRDSMDGLKESKHEWLF